MINLKWPKDRWADIDDPADILHRGDIVYHGIAPIKVMGFSIPSGPGLEKLIVQVGYPDKDGNFPDRYSTTLDYLTLIKWSILYRIEKTDDFREKTTKNS